MLLLALLSAGCTDLGRHDDVPDRAFDAAVWRAGDRRARGAMANDLETSRSLIGLSEHQVLELLGLPDSDTLGLAFEYTVDLGLRTGPWGLGGTWLFYTSVLFDSTSGKVAEVRTRD